MNIVGEPKKTKMSAPVLCSHACPCLFLGSWVLARRGGGVQQFERSIQRGFEWPNRLHRLGEQ